MLACVSVDNNFMGRGFCIKKEIVCEDKGLAL
jgi:hypothetical protein